MVISTLCYLKKDNKLLMLHRTKKNEDPNKGKWIGVGGKIEPGESPVQCVIREIKEETGLIVNSIELKGIITFVLPKWEDELTFLYVSDDFSGDLITCNEGELAWIEEDKVLDLNLWEGDKHFLTLLNDKRVFDLKLVYDNNDNLIEVKRL